MQISASLRQDWPFKWIYLLITNTLLIDLFAATQSTNNSAPFGWIYLRWHFDVPCCTPWAAHQGQLIILGEEITDLHSERERERERGKIQTENKKSALLPPAVNQAHLIHQPVWSYIMKILQCEIYCLCVCKHMVYSDTSAHYLPIKNNPVILSYLLKWSDADTFWLRFHDQTVSSIKLYNGIVKLSLVRLSCRTLSGWKNAHKKKNQMIWPITLYVQHILHHPHPSGQFGLWVRVRSSRWASCDAVTCMCTGHGRLPRDDMLSRCWCCQVCSLINTHTHTHTGFNCACICDSPICFLIGLPPFILLNFPQLSGCCWWSKQGNYYGGQSGFLKFVLSFVFPWWASDIGNS